jgi:formylglycine-generating enzyme required for sulfatase activity
MSTTNDWIFETSIDGEIRRFRFDELPLTIGGDSDAGLRLPGVAGSIQLGILDGAFFILPGRDTRNLRVEGESVAGSRWIKDGETIALDTARLACTIDGDKLRIDVTGVVTGGDTAPPDLEELAREAGDLDALEIAPIAFKPIEEQKTATTTAPSRRSVMIGSAFFVLALLGWFAFTAKSVEIVVTPVPETVGLPGTIMKLQMGERFLLSAGTHRVTAELEGYYPLDAEIEVGLSPDQTIEVEMERLPGLISLAAEPELVAEVRVDGELIGTTPISDAEIVTGRHQIEFSAERYLAEVQELEVIGGGERQALSVELTPNWAPITLTSDPPGAEVIVDGTSFGSTPIVAEIGAGERIVELRLSGYNAWADVVSVFADQAQELPTIELSEADGRIELITNPADASVSINGEYRGQTPITLNLSPGRAHQLTLAKAGFDSIERELSVVADSGRTITLDMTARMGTVEVLSQPAGAEIWIDGEQNGVTPSELTLSALPHDLEIRLDGYAVYAEAISPRPGFPLYVETTLVELNAVTGSGFPRVVETSLGQQLTIVLPGEFTMGSSRREQGRRSNEVLRAVSISEAFYLGVHEVTNAEFRAFRETHDSGRFGNESLNEDDQPVVRVTWDETAQYLNWLSIRDGFQPVYEETNGVWVAVRPLRNGYRLPTEAEWAWAARFADRDDTATFPWGDIMPPPDRSGNFADVSASSILPTHLVTYNDGFQVSSPPGSFLANPVGVFDLGGNVSEWVLDYWEVGSPQTDTVTVDRLGPEQGRFHVIRGSNWRSGVITELRLAYRNYSDSSREDVGFRIARNLE